MPGSNSELVAIVKRTKLDGIEIFEDPRRGIYLSLSTFDTLPEYGGVVYVGLTLKVRGGNDERNLFAGYSLN